MMTKIAFLSPHCLVDFTNGAAIATREGLKLLATQGFQCMAFCGTRLDEAGEGLIQEQLFRRKINYEVRKVRLVAGGEQAQCRSARGLAGGLSGWSVRSLVDGGRCGQSSRACPTRRGCGVRSRVRPRPSGAHGVVGSILRFFQAGQVGRELLVTDPAEQVELDRLEGPLGRLRAGADRDQQTDDQSRVHLQRDAVFLMRHQVSGAEHALQPTEKQFDRPAIAIGNGHQVGRQIKPVGDQPQLARLAGPIRARTTTNRIARPTTSL